MSFGISAMTLFLENTAQSAEVTIQSARLKSSTPLDCGSNGLCNVIKKKATAQIGQMTLIAVIQFEVIMSDLRMVHSGATHLLHILDHLPVHKLPHPVKRSDRMVRSPPRSSLIDEGEDDPHQWMS